VSHGDTKGEHLLELELDGTADAIDLLDEIVGVLHEGWELTELVHGRSQQTRDLLHDGGRCQEEVIPACKLLHLLLVLVEGLEGLDIHVRDASALGGLDVLGITKDAARHTWPRKVWQLDGTCETLVLLRIVVLKHNLELDGLRELALLGGSAIKNGLDGVLEGISWNLGHDELVQVSVQPLGRRNAVEEPVDVEQRDDEADRRVDDVLDLNDDGAVRLCRRDRVVDAVDHLVLVR